MTQDKFLKEKRQLINELLRELREYEAEFKRPMELKIISGKFSKRAKTMFRNFDKPSLGVREIIGELLIDGTLHKVRQESGLVLVATESLTPRLVNLGT